MPIPCRAVLTTLVFTPLLLAADTPRAIAILEQNCIRCHNLSTRMSGLSLVSAADAKTGGAHGPAIIPGMPEESALVRMISGDKPKMPMNAPPLSSDQV